MAQLFIGRENKLIRGADRPEKKLNLFLTKNWRVLFPHLQFIKSEFLLNGAVRGKDGSGRVDILAFNPFTNRFVVVELKSKEDKNIRNQAGDYRDFIEDNFEKIYLIAIEQYGIDLPKSSEIDRDNIEIVLIARDFFEREKKEIKRQDHNITLVKYSWFAYDVEEMLHLDYLNNEPDPSVIIPKKKFKISDNDLSISVNGTYLSGSTVPELYLSVLKHITAAEIQLDHVLPFSTSKRRYLMSSEPKHPGGNNFVKPISFGGLVLEAHKSRGQALSDLIKLFVEAGLSAK